MIARDFPLQLARDQRGLSLIELLVAALAGTIILLAAFATLDISLKQSTRISDRVSADQRGRLAMEKLMLTIHSSCVAVGQSPILKGSNASELILLSRVGSEAAFTTMTKHKIAFNAAEKTLTDTAYTSNVSSAATKWVFPETPATTKTTIVLTNVVEGSKPVFEYFNYTAAGKVSETAQTVPLTEVEAETAVQVNVRFKAFPEKSNSTSADRAVEFNDVAVLRLTPAVQIGGNEPCE